jgi:hypothetical protein
MLPYVEVDDPMGDAFLIGARYTHLPTFDIHSRERLHQTTVRDSDDLYL